MIEVEAVAMETQLQALNSACDLLNELCDTETSTGEGRSEARKVRDGTEARHRQLVAGLERLKDSLNAELSE